jgi:hypothetical protein
MASFQFPDLYTIGRIPWASDQLVARPLPKRRTAQTQTPFIMQELKVFRTGGNRFVSSCMQEVVGSNLNVLFKDLIEELHVPICFIPEDGGIRFLRNFDDCQTALNITKETR